MSNSIFAFATLVANILGHSPHFYEIAKEHLYHLKLFWQILYPGASPFKLLGCFQVWIKWKDPNFLYLQYSVIALFWGIWKQSHSPHLNGHSPHVACGEWVGQCWSRLRWIDIFMKDNQTWIKWRVVNWIVIRCCGRSSSFVHSSSSLASCPDLKCPLQLNRIFS